ncbi:MAG: PhzF family isomerase [Desulfovibrionaceae bacterium]
MNLKLYQVDAFTTTPFAGNPAGVVLGPDGEPAQGLSEGLMQAIARELNNSETAFVLPAEGTDQAPNHDVRVRFFTPTMEVPVCGHATIAAHYVLARARGLRSGTVVQLTGAGALPVEIEEREGDLAVTMTQGAIEISPPLDMKTELELLRALGLLESDRNARFPVRVASTGHSKVMVGINSRAALNGLKPNMAALTALSRKIGSNGYFVFTMDSDDPDVLVHGRMFAPAIGIPEDPVTGNANGPLGAYLVGCGFARGKEQFSFTAQQGEACGRPGRMLVRVDIAERKPARVRITGRAVVVFEAELNV